MESSSEGQPPYSIAQAAISNELRHAHEGRSNKELLLANCGIDTIPPEIANLSWIEILDISHNNISKFPPEIFELRGLTELNANGNLLVSLPKEIALISNLKKLRLDTNLLSDLPAELGSLASLKELNLSNNRLTHIPKELGELRSLRELIISDNLLQNLPPEIGLLELLNVLSFSKNKLTQIPAEIGCLKNLAWLYLHRNWLIDLPDAIGGLASLKQLHLHHNYLTSLPKSIAGLTMLRELTLSENKLHELPLSLKNLTNLEVLTLWNNDNLEIPDRVLGQKPITRPPKDILNFYFTKRSARKTFSALHSQEAKELLDELSDIQIGGGEPAIRFEMLVGRIIDICFDGCLVNSQHRVPDGERLVIRDWVASYTSKPSAWTDIVLKQGSSQVIFECKNTDELTKDDYDQVNRYLSRNDTLMIFVFRGMIKERDKQHVKDLCYRSTKRVLLFDGSVIVDILNNTAAGQSNDDYIREMYNELERSL